MKLFLLAAGAVAGYFAIKNFSTPKEEYNSETSDEVKQNRIASLSSSITTGVSTNILPQNTIIAPSSSSSQTASGSKSRPKPQPRPNQIYGVGNIWGFPART